MARRTPEKRPTVEEAINRISKPSHFDVADLSKAQRKDFSNAIKMLPRNTGDGFAELCKRMQESTGALVEWDTEASLDSEDIDDTLLDSEDYIEVLREKLKKKETALKNAETERDALEKVWEAAVETNENYMQAYEASMVDDNELEDKRREQDEKRQTKRREQDAERRHQKKDMWTKLAAEARNVADAKAKGWSILGSDTDNI